MKNLKKTTDEASHLTVVSKTRPSYEDITLVNPKKEPLTPAILKTFEGFETVSDEEASKLCSTSLLFAQALLEFLASKNINLIDNQHVVNSDEESGTPVIELNSLKSKTTKNKAA